MVRPKISVIIPIYNVERFLDKCISSVRNQTFRDIEILCVDDCSPDDSNLIVEKHATEDSRVSLIKHDKNLGLGGARNTAIRQAKAPYIASVDSDDSMLPDMLEVLWNASEKGWFDVVCCGFNRISETGNIISYEAFSEKTIVNDNNDINIFTATNPAFWNKLWKKSLFIDNDIFFPEHDYFEDMSTTPRILSKARYIKVIKSRLYNYLIRKQSITGSYGSKHIIDYFKGFEIILYHLKKYSLYQRYEEEFEQYVRSNILFHTKYIMGAEVSIDEKKQYLRYLLFLRISFTENAELIRNLDLVNLYSQLEKSKTIGLYHSKYNDMAIKMLENESLITGLKDRLRLKEVEISGNAKGSLLPRLKAASQAKDYYRISLGKTKQEIIELQDNVDALERTIEKERLSYQESLNVLDIEKENYKDKVNQLKRDAAERLSLAQRVGIVLFGVFIRPFMTHRQYFKLNHDPRAFFEDSKNKFTRSIGVALKIL